MTALSALLHELDRIAGHVESTRAAADRARIEALNREIADLRAAVAHLRAGAGPVPPRLRPVVARAVVETGEATARATRRPGPAPVAATG